MRHGEDGKFRNGFPNLFNRISQEAMAGKEAGPGKERMPHQRCAHKGMQSGLSLL